MTRRSLFAMLVASCCAGLPQASRAQFSIVPDLAATPRPSPWAFLPGVVFGYDSFGQSYNIAERDTLDLVDELSGRVVAAIEHRGRTHFGLKNSFGLGQQATRNDSWIQFGIGRGDLQLRAEQELHYKAYANDADFAESSDYLAGISRVGLAWELAPRWRVRLDDRFEWTDFERPTLYSYDYWLHDGTATLEHQYGVFSTVSAGYGYGVRSVPDSTVIDFHRHVFRADWVHEAGRHDLGLGQRLERRLYRDPSVRSHTWDWDVDLYASVRLHPRVRLRPEYRAEILEHDFPDSVYTDSVDQSVEMLVEGDVSRSTTLALGPRAEFRRTAAGFDRSYNQLGLKGVVTFTLRSTLWLQFSEEIGQREHLAGETLFFTDYIYNWSTLYLTWNPLPRLGLDLYFTIAPEVHEYGEDDNTLLLLSTSLTYGWR